MAEQRYPRPFTPRLIYGVCTLDNTYPVRSTHAHSDGIRHGRRCPVFVVWNRLARQCYDSTFKSSHPEYDGRTMCPEWRDSFMAFRAWLTAQAGWQGSYVKMLDQQTEYGPGTVYLSPPDRGLDRSTDWQSTRLPFPGDAKSSRFV